MESEQYSDDHLTAYLDGELDPGMEGKIRIAAEQSADLQGRLDQLSIRKSELVAAMDQLLEIAPEMPELPFDLKSEAENSAAIWLRNAKMMAAGLVMLIAGGAGGFYLNQQPADGWRDYVAAYHLLYVNSTLSNVQSDETVQTAELERVSEAIAKTIALEQVSGVAGLDYKRAQILGFEGKPLAQMTFLSKMGVPIALCVIRTDTAASKATKLDELQGMASANWTEDGYAYLLIGGQDSKMINDAAQAFRKIL
ncbi:MAG: hypothetical protein AAF423_08730 [Pseudomonadota bacterium]